MVTAARQRRRRRLATLARWTAGIGVAFVGFVGFAHTETGQAWLRYLPSPGGACPVGYDTNMDGATRDRVRTAVLSPLKGEAAAASRQVLAFTLGVTQSGDVRAWAQEHGVSCDEAEAGRALRCASVPAAALRRPFAADALLLRFDNSGALTTVDASARDSDPELAAAFVRARTETLQSEVGPLSTRQGEETAEHLRRGPMSKTAVEFRFTDLRAQVSATNMGRGRYLVRESYQAIDSGA